VKCYHVIGELRKEKIRIQEWNVQDENYSEDNEAVNQLPHTQGQQLFKFLADVGGQQQYNLGTGSWSPRHPIFQVNNMFGGQRISDTQSWLENFTWRR
jgi:hypothetical protein